MGFCIREVKLPPKGIAYCVMQRLAMIPRQTPQIHETYNHLRAGFNGRRFLHDDRQSLSQESDLLLGNSFNYGIAVLGI